MLVGHLIQVLGELEHKLDVDTCVLLHSTRETLLAFNCRIKTQKRKCKHAKVRAKADGGLQKKRISVSNGELQASWNKSVQSIQLVSINQRSDQQKLDEQYIHCLGVFITLSKLFTSCYYVSLYCYYFFCRRHNTYNNKLGCSYNGKSTDAIARRHFGETVQCI